MSIYLFESEEELAKALLDLGDQHFDAGCYEKSYVAYYKASKQIQSARCHYNLGILELKIGDKKAAESQFQKAYELAKGKNEEIRVLVAVYQRWIENGEIAEKDVLHELEGYMKEGSLSQQDKDCLFSYLCWYYDRINDLESCITSFLQIEDMGSRKASLSIFMRNLVREGKWNSYEKSVADLKEAFPYDFHMMLIKVYLNEGKVQEALNLLTMLEAWKGNRKDENKDGIFCYKAYAYLKLKQVIMAIDSLNRVKVERLNEEEAFLYDTAICQLAQLNNNYTKEVEGYQQMINKIIKKYRRMELGKVEIYEGFF